MRFAVVMLVAVMGLVACGEGSVPITPDAAGSAAVPPTSRAVPKPAEPAHSATTDADGDLLWIVLPDSTGRMPADVELGCPTGPSFPASVLDEIRPLSGSGLEEIEPAIRGFLDDEEGQYWPQDDWHVLQQTEDMVLLVHLERPEGSVESPDEIRLAFMTVEQVDGGWRWAGAQSGGTCRLVTMLPDGLNRVEWRIDPSAEPPSLESTTIALLVTEQNCASGQSMGERLLGPEIVMTEKAVLVAFAASSPSGDYQTCPGNPEQAVVIELPEPSGNREVSDGLAVAGYLEDFFD